MSSPSTGRGITAALIVGAAAFGLFAWKQLENAAAPETAIPEVALARLQSTRLSDSGGTPRTVGEWNGKVLVINFWATWCPPCRKEMPAFSRINEKLAAKGVQFIGIGIDSPSAIKEFALQSPVSYPLLIGGTEGLELLRALGNQNGALPYTLILARDGQPAFSRLGMIEEAELETLLTPLLGS